MTEYKGYNIATDDFGMKYIKTIGRGSLPNPLRGQFTSLGVAKKAIDYEKSKKHAEDSNSN